MTYIHRLYSRYCEFASRRYWKNRDECKGAQSGIYGANAVAGVINIVTKKASNGLKVNSNISYGSYNTKKASLSISNRYRGVIYIY